MPRYITVGPERRKVTHRLHDHRMKMVAAGWLKLLLQSNGEVGLAGVSGIIEGFAASITLRSTEVDPVLDPFGQANEAELTVGVGAGFQIELADVHESVGDVHVDLGSVDWRTAGIGDG